MVQRIHPAYYDGHSLTQPFRSAKDNEVTTMSAGVLETGFGVSETGRNLGSKRLKVQSGRCHFIYPGRAPRPAEDWRPGQME